MDRKAKLVCSVVGFLGVLSAALSFAAEATRTTASQFDQSYTCPSSPASALGLAAAVVLLTDQIIVAAICSGSYPSNSSWTSAIICFVVSWIAFVIAFLTLLISAAINQGVGADLFGCSFVQPGVFAGAAFLSLASVVLGIVYYLALDSAKIKNGTAAAPNQIGIEMAQPQFPPPQSPPPHVPPPDTEAPVFVHEDTYMRRQST